ncbi:MAG: peptidase S8 [Candidatus Yanofskybacteria bacterium CG10_big_fil_rev_8_21_14_0_10_37_15]|uniref:Peptidase S8 n=1 Tax=Candidatus Yanofskybacteria bacterium CG10_big_fil_rev_8_21_14_0_10_37_15 TaxID=1975097 RepID=A0A2H0R5V7_9BACT|nr:MAG: peptidase S8 [Candidatus Yanofskybacteria bacterium CG10_big_fil_rev_8_21_14_0_10_37_15]
MKTKKIAYILILMLFFSTASSVLAVEDNGNRYLVKSNSNFWKKSFTVRHNFDNGFTADLSDFQLRFAKIFGVELEPVKKVYILPAEQTELSAPKKNVQKRIFPSEQVPWGVKSIYNESVLEKTNGGAGVNVAVLDTGVLKTHPDIKNRIKECKDFSNNRTPLIDGKCDDKNGHGTHVSGSIAADGGSDGQGIYGIAPGANLFAYKVCSDNGFCWADDIAIAIRAAAENGANIINLSLGSDAESQLISDAVNFAVSKNVLIVAAAGNDGPYDGSIDYPAAKSSTVAVGAFNSVLEISEWSSRGINSLSEFYVVEDGDMEFAAPGVSVESTWKDGGYAVLSGTSMAAPHVSGLAAKLWQKDAENPASSTRDLLHWFSVDLQPSGDDNSSGWGFPRL